MTLAGNRGCVRVPGFFCSRKNVKYPMSNFKCKSVAHRIYMEILHWALDIGY